MMAGSVSGSFSTHECAALHRDQRPDDRRAASTAAYGTGMSRSPWMTTTAMPASPRPSSISRLGSERIIEIAGPSMRQDAWRGR